MPLNVTGTKSAEEAERLKAKAHVIFNATAQQIDNYIDANVTDLASAREFLKDLTKIMIFGFNKLS